jgi:6-pyruvoyltetrahydropterin/6-carboxytetrahydropterin synthase
MTGLHRVTVRHNFETAHRLPHLGGKCRNLHGHSWWADVTVSGPKRPDGTVVEFGALKASLRGWIDAHLDHGAMLGAGDPLVDALTADGTKLYRFGAQSASGPERLAYDLHWPTVESVALLLARVTTSLTAPTAPGLTVARVQVRETHVNAAEYLP